MYALAKGSGFTAKAVPVLEARRVVKALVVFEFSSMSSMRAAVSTILAVAPRGRITLTE
jgi:hypothetical protein